MATDQLCTILRQEPAAPDTYTLWLRPSEPVSVLPGQFLNLAIPGVTLRRPISVTDVQDGVLRLTYRVAGKGTALLSRYPGDTIHAILPLGNGFPLPEANRTVLIIGGGIGCAPLYGLVRAAVERNCRVTVVFGFREPKQALFWEELQKLPVRAHYCYDSEGETVATILRQKHLESLPFYACGPLAMLKAVDKVMRTDGWYSLECRMGCGFGACMGCSVELKRGMRRICKDGPVFSREEILWANLR